VPIGYARVSTLEQIFDLQLDALKKGGSEPDPIQQFLTCCPTWCAAGARQNLPPRPVPSKGGYGGLQGEPQHCRTHDLMK